MKAITLPRLPKTGMLDNCNRYRGMLQILLFNWPLYAVAFAIFTVTGAILPHLNIGLIFKGVIAFGIGCALFWTFVSLLVSHWIYDRSALPKWNWIKNFIPTHINRAASIHCGFDESRGALHRLFPGSTIFAWDIYQPDLMTESSIARARKICPSTSNTTLADFASLPTAANALDAVFLIFAAHEIRLAEARDKFFRELFRVLKPGGTVLVVEHLRDWRNLLAFGPGFLHFLPEKEWLRLSNAAGFVKVAQERITPFVLVLMLSKPETL